MDKTLMWTLKRNESVARTTFPSRSHRTSCGLGIFGELSCSGSTSMLSFEGSKLTIVDATRPSAIGICHDGCVASVDSKLRVCHWQWKTPFVFQDFAVVAIAQQTLNISYDLEVNKYGGEREDHDEGPVCDTVLCSRTPTRTPCPSFKFFNLFERRLPFSGCQWTITSYTRSWTGLCSYQRYLVRSLLVRCLL